MTGPPTAPTRRPASSARTDFAVGVGAMSAVTVAYLPFGLLVGAAVASSADPVAAWAATWVIYGGAAHLAVLEVLAQGSGWAAAAAVGLLVNVRLAAYSTAMAPRWRDASARAKLLAAVMLTDAPWALANARPVATRGYYLGAASTLFVAWPVIVTLGAASGGLVSALAALALVPVLTLGAVVVPQLRQRPVAWGVAAAAISAAATARLDAGASLLLCAAAGLGAALYAERRS